MADHGNVITVTSYEEWKQILNENSGKAIVVDFWATWCGPCKQIAPEFVKFSQQYTNVVFVKVDVDQNQKIAQEESISAMPTFRVYKDGKKVAELIGASKDKLEGLISSNA